MPHLFASPRRPRSLALSARPRLEPLEDRLVPAVITVNRFIDGVSTPFTGNVAANLRSAIDFSAAGDEIDLAGGVYTLASELLVSHDLLIRSAAGGTAVIDARQHGRVFEIGVTADVTLTGLIVTGGIPGSGQGGGILNNGALTVSGSSLSGNSASSGGGIVNNGALAVSSSTLASNSAFGSGGGILNYGTLAVSNSTLKGNSATTNGGGIVNNGTLVVSYSTLAGNSATGTQGGGIFNSGGLTVRNSTLTGNSAAGQGGGIFNGGGLRVENSTLANNSASDGGGLFLGGSISALLVNDTIAQNTARGQPGLPGHGGGVAVGASTPRPRIWNTLIAGNNASTGPDVYGLIASLGHNLIGSTAGSTGFTAARGDQLDVSPGLVGLGPLANNGGPTQTMRPAPYSRAIDRGDDGVLTSSLALLSTDQRGQPRRLGAHVDIGAYEQ